MQSFTRRKWEVTNIAEVSRNIPKGNCGIPGLLMCKECQIPERLRRYLIGNPWPKDHKEDPSTDGRITPNRTFAKWRSEIGQLASRIERNGRRTSLRRPKLAATKESSAPGRRRSYWRRQNIFKNLRLWKSNFKAENIFLPVIIVMIGFQAFSLHPNLTL